MTAEPTQQALYEPSQDERTLACISHLTIFVSSIGLLIAIGLWLYLRDKQPYAAFQAAQAVIFQVIVMVLTFFVIIMLMIVFFGALGIGVLTGSETSELAFGIFAAMLTIIFFGVIVTITLALYGYAIYAAIRSYQGRAFRIPGIAALANAISPMPRVASQERAP